MQNQHCCSQLRRTEAAQCRSANASCCACSLLGSMCSSLDTLHWHVLLISLAWIHPYTKHEVALCCAAPPSWLSQPSQQFISGCKQLQSATGSRLRLDAIKCACIKQESIHSHVVKQVCNQVLTEGTALPCRALSPATPDWRGANLASALIAHPIRSDIIVDCVSLSFGYSHLATTRICWQVLSCMVKLS